MDKVQRENGLDFAGKLRAMAHRVETLHLTNGPLGVIGRLTVFNYFVVIDYPNRQDVYDIDSILGFTAKGLSHDE